MIRDIWLSVLLLGCGASAPPAEGAPPAPPTASTSSSTSPGGTPSIDAMTERMLCGGPCPPGALAPAGDSDVMLILTRPRPAYQVTMRADGTVLYQGRRFVKVRGPAEGHVDPAEVRRLIHRFENAGFRFDAHDVSASLCGKLATDLPATTLTLVRGGRRLQVIRYACEGGPLQLADEIDAVAGTARWVRCDADTPVPCQQ